MDSPLIHVPVWFVLVGGWMGVLCPSVFSFTGLKIGLYTPSPKLTKLTFQIGSQRRHSILDV